MIDKKSKYTVFYHANCIDGFFSACICLKFLLKNKIKIQNIDFIPSLYDQEIELDKILDRNIFILDFSWKENEMNVIVQNCKSLTWIDHHSGSEKLFNKIRNNFKLTEYSAHDNNYCGTTLTWKSLLINENSPKILMYIEDYDLHKKIFKTDTDSVVEYVNYSCNFNEPTIEVLKEKFLSNESKHIGKILLNQKNTLVKKMCSKRNEFSFSNIKIGVVNSSIYNNEVANYLCENFDCDIGISFYFDKNLPNKKYWKHSVRTSRNDIDVQSFCENFGGSGHKKASGFCHTNNINDILAEIEKTVYGNERKFIEYDLAAKNRIKSFEKFLNENVLIN